MWRIIFKTWFIFFLLIIFTGTAICSDEADGVSVSRDDKGVWFITGPDSASLYKIYEAMGHAVATDRLWQMELYRRTATGRMAEIFGTMNNGGFVETDIFMRTLGYSEEELNQAFDNLDQDSQDMIEGYVSGVNQRIVEIGANRGLLPFEFAALNTMPEPWTVNQIMAWSATMQRNFDPEALDTGQLDNAALLSRLSEMFGQATGFAMFNDLRWTNDPAAPSMIDHEPKPRGNDWCNTKATLKIDLKNVAAEMKAKNKRIIATLEKANARVKMGSYAWVISGDKTKSGNPIIYSGPQMGFSVPSIVVEGSIRAGGLDVSGMTIPGLPGIVIGRTPHHAWSMQVGHAHTTDYYFDHPSTVNLHRMELIKVLGSDDINLPVFHSSHGPVVSPLPYNPATYSMETQGPIVSWKYSHVNYELASIGGFLKLAKATSMDQFGEGIRELGVSQHFCYVDVDGNIAYWMSGRDPVRPAGEWRLPQGTLTGIYQEWDSSVLRPVSTDRNTPRGWYGGWNNKSNANYPGGFNGYYTQYGPFHRTHVIYDYFDKKLRGHRKLSFNKIRDLALNIATTDSFYGGGNPWKFVKRDFTRAVYEAGWNIDRFIALGSLRWWDGHFVEGGKSNWASGENRSKAWVLMDRWIDEVIRLTFADELAVPDENGDMVLQESDRILFNVLLHGLEYPESLTNNYDWFQNILDTEAPQTINSIIVTAFDTVLGEWDALPPETFERGSIEYNHDLIGPVWKTPKSSRSTYAHCVEYGADGPVRIESMFPLGESGMLWINPENPTVPTPDNNFFSMTPEFDSFAPRQFPLF